MVDAGKLYSVISLNSGLGKGSVRRAKDKKMSEWSSTFFSIAKTSFRSCLGIREEHFPKRR